MPIAIHPSVDVLTLETGHVYIVEGEISTDYNHPINSSFAHLTYEVLGSVFGSNGYKVIKCTDADSGKKWTRTQRWGAWNDWVPDATATPLQEFDYYPASINIYVNGNCLVGYGGITHSGAINLHGFIEFPTGS